VKGREEAEDEAEAEAAGEGQPLKSRYLSTGPYQLELTHCSTSATATTLTTSINQADTATSDCFVGILVPSTSRPLHACPMSGDARPPSVRGRRPAVHPRCAPPICTLT
jgi:hypothetical protein